MKAFEPEQPVNAQRELCYLLERNGIDYEQTGQSWRMRLSAEGRCWEARCVPVGAMVLIYGIYPFLVCNRERAQGFCASVNKQAVFGGAFWQDERLIFRTGADLFDLYTAYETIARSLEYNAGIITAFWTEAEGCKDEADRLL